MAKIGHVLFEQIGLEGLVQTGSSFGSRGHPRSLRMVPFDTTKFPIFSLPGTICISRVVLELWCGNEIAENKNWLLWQRPSMDRKSRFRSLSTAMVEPNGENHVKIRPVEVKIKWLTEIL